MGSHLLLAAEQARHVHQTNTFIHPHLPPSRRSLRLGIPHADQRLGRLDHLLGAEETALGCTLHGVDVVLVRVAAREEEVGDDGVLCGTKLVHAGSFAVERLKRGLGRRKGGVQERGVGEARESKEENKKIR
eukprot:446229-Hanusia_phi.AAC.3